MDKAQEVKRKWNLEDNVGTKKSSSSSISNVDLLSVAKDIGIVLKDGNPEVVNQMIAIDSSRRRDRERQCQHPGCGSASGSGLNPEDNVENPTQINKTSNQQTRNRFGDAEDLIFDQEKGWSIVGNKKKNKKKKK